MMASEVNKSVSSPTGDEKIISVNHVDSGTISTTDQSPEIETKATELGKTTTAAEQGVATTTIPLSNSSDALDSSERLPTFEKVASETESKTNQEATVTTEVTSAQTEQENNPPQRQNSNIEPSSSEVPVVEAETDSKEENLSSVPRSEPQSPSINSKQNHVAVDVNAAPSLGGYDFITSPHGNNAIVERSPGERYVRFMEKLGSGASKEVYRAYDTQEGIEVAWNVVHLAGVPRNERNRIVNEVQLLERLHHHNIISFHGSWVNREQQQVNFVTEILSSGTLKSFITKVQVIRWKIAKRWAIQILKGLEYLHSQEPPVIHRDLKCENIFINGTSGDLRIGDLGLSTVHRNGKQLSVLGTPEFMAPDMYEENPYDEKVDVYSFGMCILEIFTKEIPYRECSNPAQIYKRVSRGDPPESLKRIQSKQARAFVELCLGYLDENGKYIRPSATELLAHEFLQNHPNDDDEVKVTPPIQERTIGETTSATSSPNLKPAEAKTRVSPASSSSQPPTDSLKGASSSSSKQKQPVRSDSLEDYESDRFDEMPDSEVNIKKVKVMVGRDVELQDEGQVTSTAGRVASSESLDATLSVASSNATSPPAGETSIPGGAVDPNGLSSPPAAQPDTHYLVAAAVIENEYSNVRPYQDDVLKLVVTLPVEGQTQNVQFDFHLVEDDAVQVAKEMVAELSIPQSVVLEISETVSGLARAARVNQEKYIARQQAQGHVRSSSQIPSVSSMTGMQGAANTEIQQGIVQQTPPIGQVQNPGMVQSTSHPQIAQQTVQGHPQAAPPAHVQQPIHQQGVPVQDQPQVQRHAQQIGQPASMPHLQMQPQNVMSQQHASVPQLQVQPQNAMSQNTEIVHQPPESSSQQPSYGQQPVQMNSQQIQQHVAPPTYGHSVAVPAPLNTRETSATTSQSDVSSTATYGHTPTTHAPVPTQIPQPLQAAGPSPESLNQVPVSFAGQVQPNVPTLVGHQGVQMHPAGSQQVGGAHVMPQQQQPVSIPTQHSNVVQQPPQQIHVTTQAGQSQSYANALAPQHQPPPASLQAGQQVPNNPQQVVSAAGIPGPVDSSGGYPQTFQSHVGAAPQQEGTINNSNPQQAAPDGSASTLSQVNGVLEAPAMLNLSESSGGNDEELAAELRQLDKEYKKTVMRAKKVFDSRMDNMTRLSLQREAQHQRTLADHEKQRADFEKRLQQEAIEQNRRIEQLQLEYERKRQEVQLAQENEASSEFSMEMPPPVDETMIPTSNSSGDEDGES